LNEVWLVWVVMLMKSSEAISKKLQKGVDISLVVA